MTLKCYNRSQNLDLTHTERSDIEIVQIIIFFIELSTKIVDRLCNEDLYDT